MKRNLLFLLVALLPMVASAYDAEIDGIFYNFSGDEAEVANGWYYETVVIPESVTYNGTTYAVTSIGKDAFRACVYLTSVIIPNSVTSIGDGAFYDCRALPSITIPSNVTTIGNDAFNCCYALSSITLPNSVISIGKRAFTSCRELTSIIIPDGVTSIEENTFNGCRALTSVIIPDNVTSIDYGAFYNCQALTSVIIPDGVTTIVEDVFFNCRSLSTVNIPSNVTTIGNTAFYNCIGLTSLSIGKGVTSIGRNAFKNCVNLTDVYSYAEEVPQTEGTVFTFNDGTPIVSATLHVPAGSIDKYKTTSPWSEFGSIVAIEPQNGAFLSEGMAWVDGFGYEQDGHYKTDDVKLFYYITVGDTLIDDKSYFRIQRIKTCKTKTYEESKYEVFDDNLCFFMREDDAGDVWLYAKDRDVFYRLSGNTLYDYLADGLVGRDLFLFNAKKKYAVGDKVPLGMSALEDPNGFQEGEDYWHIYSLDVEDVSERNLLDGKTYPIYNNYFLESIGPLDGPLSGIGSPNSYNLDFRQLFAFYRNGQLIYRNEGYIAALEDFFPNILDIITGSSPAEIVTFTENQMATIILPTEPDANKGWYYRLDRCENGQIIFVEELQPQARTPYIIVPSEDFSINLETLDLEGLSSDTVSIKGISFIGSYISKVLPDFTEEDGGGFFYIDIIDSTPDCLKAELDTEECVIGALRAYLQVSWDDPYNPGGSKGPTDKMEIVLKDDPNAIGQMANDKLSNGKYFDLSGRQLSRKPAKGIYIENGKKKVK